MTVRSVAVEVRDMYECRTIENWANVESGQPCFFFELAQAALT